MKESQLSSLRAVLEKSKENVSDDKNLLTDMLGSDCNFPIILKDYFFSNETFDFKKIGNVNKCFFETEIFKSCKTYLGLNSGLHCVWEFNSFLYKNIDVDLLSLGGTDYNIEVSRREYDVDNEEVRSGLLELGLKDFSVIDFEFFEVARWGSQYDASGYMKAIGKALDNINYAGLRDFIKEERLHVEKEKVHFKVVRAKNKSDNIVYLPLYVGLGTNEGHGLAKKNENNKKRWFKLSLDSKVSYLEYGCLDYNGVSQRDFDSFDIDSSLFIMHEDTFSKEDGSFIYTLVCLDKKINEDFFKCFLKVPHAFASSALTSSQCKVVEPEFRKEVLNRIDFWRDFLRENSIENYIFNLMCCMQRKYGPFSSILNCPYKIISEVGKDKILSHVRSKYKKILNQWEFDLLEKRVEEGDIRVLASDFYMLGIDSERNKILTLLIQALIKSGRFENLFLKVESHAQ